MTDLFIIAGEASGDQLGEGLLTALYRKNPHLKVLGVGGPKMRAVGMQVVFPMEELQVMGFIDVLFSLPHLISRFRKTVDAILKTQPKVVVTIDYPGFNLRLARTLRKKGYRGKICHYICPSVWAWGKKRIPLMAENLDLLLSVLPFEKKLFESTRLRVDYIGHPLVQKISPQEIYNPTIAFFPGSRTKEIERNFPFFLRLIETLKRDFPSYHYVVSVSQEKYRPLLQKLARTQVPLLSPEELDEQKPFLAVAKSGTVTLELALKEIPTVVTYAISPFDIFLARHVFKISLPFYALPNLIAGKAVFPELIGPALTDDSLLREVKNLIVNRDVWEQCRKECRHLRSLLGSENANERSAELILSLLKE
ncbi:MAG: lipid-A-disaccharide synthase [Thermodesulfobacteriota bacterium]